jgi:ring-1,2-phenylacetyl-CoA epoxidase subunit PaaC
VSAVAAGTPATITIAADAPPLLRYTLRLGDTCLILGQRLGEWVGHAPAIEEDMALANLALDCVGQARLFLSYAAEIDGRGLTEDDLAFRRDEADFFNLLLAEQANGDFGRTVVRQFLLDAFLLELFAALARSRNGRLAAIGAKSEKELRYHLRFSQGWLIRLGDGTDESHRRVQQVLDELWRFSSEFWATDAVDTTLVAQGIAPDPAALEAPFRRRVGQCLTTATLTQPADAPLALSGRAGRHTEPFGRLLAEMQFMQRAYPGAQW